ncbi:hypothetical protein DXT74_01050 [Chromobacterium sp. Rain0013]|nr:hypothetical protein DXT74_01050 [Chromobacterium sp. Rain0013]
MTVSVNLIECLLEFARKTWIKTNTCLSLVGLRPQARRHGRAPADEAVPRRAVFTLGLGAYENKDHEQALAPLIQRKRAPIK